MGNGKHLQLIDALRPFLHREESRINSFLEEDMEFFVSGIEAFGVEDMMIEYAKTHPHATTQELYHFFSDNTESVPPGQEDILDDWDDDE